MMDGGYVTFRLGERVYAAALPCVREIVRLEGLEELPGMTAPLVGVLEVRGFPLPVLDGRPLPADGSPRVGDVLVLEATAAFDAVGVVVDRVVSVLDEGELRKNSVAAPLGSLPSYVVDVLHGANGQVFMVDLRQIYSLVPA
jgi:chemotaxis signal transduction protein